MTARAYLARLGLDWLDLHIMRRDLLDRLADEARNLFQSKENRS